MALDQSKEFRLTLETETSNYAAELSSETVDRLVTYFELLTAWNPRLHLVAPTSAREFAMRHVLESLLLLKHLPQDARVADIGSGAGLPMIPCLIVRPDIHAVLIESSKKKAVFLREALRQIEDPSRASVIGERFQDVDTPEVGFVTCRALERFGETVPQMVRWAPGRAWFLLFGGEGLRESLVLAGLQFTGHLIPNSRERFLYVGQNQN